MVRKVVLLLFSFFKHFLPYVSADCHRDCLTISFHVKNGLNNKQLEDIQGKLDEMTVEYAVECFQYCVLNCQCTSFNFCGKTCQLNKGNQFLLRNALRSSPECFYYDFPRTQCDPTAAVKNPCCVTYPPPCLNDGICGIGISDMSPRLHCTCPTGFYGLRCEIDHPRSCLDYWNTSWKPVSGKHTIHDDFGNSYEVWCDFDSEEGVAWTLIESFTMDNEAHIVDYPFTLDHPLNEYDFNWQLFRLPKHVMVTAAMQAEFWRGTCSFPVYGVVDYRDYIRVRMSEMDITTYVAEVTHDERSCKLVDYMNIKGQSCVNCTVAVFQVPNEMLHINERFGRIYCGCTFDSSTNEYFCKTSSARKFGIYHHCHDPSFRCSETTSSTTQFWFGAKSKF